MAVVAPSGQVDPVRLEEGCGRLRELGLDVVVGKHTLDQATLAGSGGVPALDSDAGVLTPAGAR